MKFFMFLQAAYLFFNQHVTLTFGGAFGESLTQAWRALGSLLLLR